MICGILDDENAFDDTCRHIQERLDEYSASVRSSKYADADIFTVYGVNVSSLHEAIYGLRHIEELSYTVAEHHPYWRLLNGLVEALRITLDKWKDDMSEQDMNDMLWCLSSVTDELNRLKSKGDSDH